MYLVGTSEDCEFNGGLESYTVGILLC